MRVLLMISNSNMSIREQYTQVLHARFPNWGISNMSGLPKDPGSIVKSFDALVYELGAPDDPRRYQATLSLLDELKEAATTRVITHVEGPYREGIVAELEDRGVICIGVPFGPDTIAAAFRQAAPTPPAQPTTQAGEGRGVGSRLRGLFRRKE